MPRRIQGPIRRALKTLQGAAGVEVTYRRGEDEVAVMATKSEVDMEIDRGDAGLTVLRLMQWRILAEDLVLGGTEIEPQKGDRIEEITGGVLRTYETMAVRGDSPYELVDADGTAYRVHTSLVSEQATTTTTSPPTTTTTSAA